MRPTRLPRPARILWILNRQHCRPIDSRWLRRMLKALLQELFGLHEFELGLNLITSREMARLNEQYLCHAGPTDVLAFDYSPSPAVSGKGPRPGKPTACGVAAACEAGNPRLHGEIFICVEEAVAQAARFRTNWPCELTRYLVHGILHLRGFDDTNSAERRRMKREEDRLLRELQRRFVLSRLRAPTRRVSLSKFTRAPTLAG